MNRSLRFCVTTAKEDHNLCQWQRQVVASKIIFLSAFTVPTLAVKVGKRNPSIWKKIWCTRNVVDRLALRSIKIMPIRMIELPCNWWLFRPWEQSGARSVLHSWNEIGQLFRLQCTWTYNFILSIQLRGAKIGPNCSAYSLNYLQYRFFVHKFNWTKWNIHDGKWLILWCAKLH